MPEHIAASHEVLAALHDLTPTMSFKPSSMEAALKAIWKKSNIAWQRSADTESEWVVCFTRRVLNICRVVGQAGIKHKGTTPTWYRSLPWAGQGATYFYGFNTELMNA
eukprot:5792385-Alexandrium_andersonii.AAC.1